MHFHKPAVRPVVAHHQFAPEPVHMRIGRSQHGKERRSFGREECPDDKVEFFHALLAFPRFEHLVDDQGNNENFDGQEGDVADQKDQDMLRIMEDEKMDSIERQGKGDEPQRCNDFPPGVFSH